MRWWGWVGLVLPILFTAVEVQTGGRPTVVVLSGQATAIMIGWMLWWSAWR